MKLKFRNQFTVAAVGALACSLAFQPLGASAAQNPITGDDRGLVINQGEYVGTLSGADRFGTAVAASKSLGDSVGNTVILSNWQAWSDVLASTPIADLLDAPVLYTLPDRLEAKTKAEIARLAALHGQAGLNVIIVGGTNVVSHDVSVELAGMGVSVDRISGDDRYETALNLAAEAVDYYDDGNADLAGAREVIVDIIHAEAAFQAALVEWNASRDETAAAFDAVVAAQAAVDAANAALQALIDGLVSVPDADAAQLNTLSNILVQARDDLADLGTLEAFINDRLSEYVADGNSVDFQDDVWNSDVVPFFGGAEFTIELNAGTYEGTLDDLAGEIAAFGAAVSEGGTDNTVKEVEIEIDAQTDAAQAAVDDAQADYAELVAALVAQAEAEENNAALMEQIADAQAAVVAAEEARDDARDGYFDAREDEADAKAAFEEATALRPAGDADEHAQLVYDQLLADTIELGKAYPAFVATGRDFADALAAGPAASSEAGVVLLTQGTAMAPATQVYLNSGPSTVAVGGPASEAFTADVEYVGATRYETAADLAVAYFDDYDFVGLASGRVAADAVVGGALMANVDGPILLTAPNTLSAATSTFLSYEADNPYLVIFGGPAAISNSVKAEAQQALIN